MKPSICFTCDSATIKATFKNKKTGKTYKSKISIKVTVEAKKAAFAVTETEMSLVVGASQKITFTGADVAFKSSDEKVATVDAKTGEVKAIAAGKATITATCGTESKEVVVTVTRTALKAVVQDTFDTVIATIDGDTASIATKDVIIKNSAARVIAVKAVKVDATDKTKVTITAFENMSDGKEYTMTLDGITKTFTVTDGKVASVGVDKTTIPAGRYTEINVVAKDVNGVTVYKQPYAAVDASKYTVEIKSTAASYAVEGSKILLAKVGDEAIAKVTWKSGKFDATGKPEGNIESGECPIKAVDPAVVDSFDLRIGENGKKYADLKANTSVKKGDANAYAYFMIKDAEGVEIARYADYTLESTNPGVLTLVGTFGTNNGVKLVPTTEGTAFILIKKNGAVVSSIEITVVAPSDAASLTLDKTAVTMSNAADTSTVVTATVKDQYSADINLTATNNVSVEILSVSGAVDNAGEYAAVKSSASSYYTIANNKVTFLANVNKGTYEYRIYYKNSKGVEFSQRCVVTIQAPAGPHEVDETVKLEVTPSVDTKIAQYNTDDKYIDINVAIMSNDVKRKTAALSDSICKIKAADDQTINNITYKVTKDGKTIATYNASTAAVTSAAGIKVSVTGATMRITARDLGSSDASPEYKLAAGKYKVEAEVIIDKTPGKIVPGALEFTITDTQDLGTVSLRKAKPVVGAGKSLDQVLIDALQYSGYGYNIGADSAAGQKAFAVANKVVIKSIEGTCSVSGKEIIKSDGTTPLNGITCVNGTNVNVTKITLTVEIPDTSKWVDITIDCSAAPITFTCVNA